MDRPAAGATLRDVMSAYPTGITIVAACDEENVPYGLTVNSFTSVSLDPPLVLVCIGHTATSHDRLVRTSAFSVNVLSAGQGEAASRFATEPSEGRFDEVTWERSGLGSPLIEDSVAWLDCSVHEVLQGGDHSILLGRVHSARSSDRPALIFHRGHMSASE